MLTGVLTDFQELRLAIVRLTGPMGRPANCSARYRSNYSARVDPHPSHPLTDLLSPAHVTCNAETL